jgi:hypothetical protein
MKLSLRKPRAHQIHIALRSTRKLLLHSLCLTGLISIRVTGGG